MWHIAGLGNPEKEYDGTRHNIGRDVVLKLAKAHGMEFKKEAKSKADVAKGKIGKESVVLILPDVGMNASGKAVGAYVKSAKAAKDLLVIHDDIDMGLGSMKIVFNRGSGGHRGVESVVRAVKTEAMYRLKLGVLPLSPSGKPKKPKGKDKIIALVLGEFRAPEKLAAAKAIKRALEAVETVVSESPMHAASVYNG